MQEFEQLYDYQRRERQPRNPQPLCTVQDCRAKQAVERRDQQYAQHNCQRSNRSQNELAVRPYCIGEYTMLDAAHIERMHQLAQRQHCKRHSARYIDAARFHPDAEPCQR